MAQGQVVVSGRYHRVEGKVSALAPKWNIVGRSEERRSRLHTQRGERISLREAAKIPSLILERLIGPVRPRPWMAPGAIKFLDKHLSRRQCLVELGSGASTAWYGARVGRTISIEPSAEWARKVEATVGGLNTVQIWNMSIAQGLQRLPDDLRIDVVIVDHSSDQGISRPEAVRLVAPRAEMVVLDDSDRPAYQAVDELLVGWHSFRFTGMRARPFMMTETTIFTRRE